MIALLRDPLRFLVEKVDDHRRINQLHAAVNALAEMLDEQKDRIDVTQEIAVGARVKALDALSIAQEWAAEKRGKA
jgi:DNA-binding FrmR family transcriptional regulator